MEFNVRSLPSGSLTRLLKSYEAASSNVESIAVGASFVPTTFMVTVPISDVSTVSCAIKRTWSSPKKSPSGVYVTKSPSRVAVPLSGSPTKLKVISSPSGSDPSKGNVVLFPHLNIDPDQKLQVDH